MSLCAKCGSVMGERTYREMPIEVCPECQGQWMDHTTLEHILNKLAADQLVGSLQFGALAEFMNRVASVETDYPCPACKRTTLVSHSHQGIEIDWCPTCHGVFLDCNEIGLLAAWRRSKTPDSNPPYGFDTGQGFLWFLSELFR
jgi:Zn-finger nucleic acid-binding protein